MPPLTLALHAMATRFEMVLPGDKPVALRAAGEEALEEIARIEAQLSLYRPTSEIAHLNARAARGPVRVTPGLFALLQHAKKLSQESGGAFDITIAPLVRCWGFMGGGGAMPEPQAVAAAHAKVGMDQVELDPENLTVQFAREGMMLDLGAIGKGYAIERAVEVLREAGVVSALLHGGTSTAYALGHPPEADSWKIAIENPQAGNRSDVVAQASSLRLSQQASGLPEGPRQPGGLADAGKPEAYPKAPPLLATVPLRDQAMSVSAVWGRSFEAEGKTFGHILDPRTGYPATNALLAAIVLPSATETDALSTALLVVGPQKHEAIARLRPGARTLVVAESGGRLRVEAKGITCLDQ